MTPLRSLKILYIRLLLFALSLFACAGCIIDLEPVVKLLERRKARRFYLVGDRRRAPQPEGPFPELAARSLVLIISGCVTWVTAWAVYFASQGWNEGLVMIPLFIAWVLFVLFFRGVKLRINGVVQ